MQAEECHRQHSRAIEYPQLEVPKVAGSFQGNCLLTCPSRNTAKHTANYCSFTEARNLCRFTSEEGLARRAQSHRSFPQTHRLQRDWHAPDRAHLGKDEQDNGLMVLCLSTAGHFVQLEGKRQTGTFHVTGEPQATRKVQRWFSLR